jgi:beta-lactamase class A
MIDAPSRRQLLALGAATVLIPAAAWAAAAANDPIAEIERRHGGRLGVYVHELGTHRTLAHRADESFMLCSTFKGLLAAFALWRAQTGTASLDTAVRVTKADLLPHSPISAAHVAAGTMTVRQMCEAVTSVSDNGAANLLMRHLGGPAVLTAFIRKAGDPVTRVDRYELVPSDRSGQDSTTPRAIAETAGRLVWGDVLGAPSRTQLERWMIACEVGKTRLRATLPHDWTVGDRTGTGDGLCNEYAIARLPGGRRLVIAAYYDKPGMETDAQEAVLREVGTAIARWQASPLA